jgi:hypothetical protein
MQKSDLQKRVKDDILRRIQTEEDYIRSKKFHNSLNKFISKNPDGSEDAAIARILMIAVEDVEKIYNEAVAKLRAELSKDK